MFLTAVATTVPSPGLEIAPWDDPLKARKPNNRMNPPKAASCKIGEKMGNDLDKNKHAFG